MIISMLPSGILDNKVFPDTIIKIKSNQWTSLDGQYKYTAIVDGIGLKDLISFKLSPVSSTPTEEELYTFSLITNFKYGINYIELTAKKLPVINFNILLYRSSFTNKEIYDKITYLEEKINNATTDNIPDTLVLRDDKGRIPYIGTIADNAKNDEYGRNIAETYAPIDSPTFTNSPTTPYPDSKNSKYYRTIPNVQFVLDAVDSGLSKLDFLSFAGTVGDGGNFETLPENNVKNGYVYKVITDGTYGGYECVPGDLLVARYDSPISSTDKDDWSFIPSGDDDTTTLRITDNNIDINITNIKSSGDIILGNIVTKTIDTSFENKQSENIPTTNAVYTYVEDRLNNLVNTAAIKTITYDSGISIEDCYRGSLSIEHIKSLPTEYYSDVNKLFMIKCITCGDQNIYLSEYLKAINESIYDEICRADDYLLLDKDIDLGDWYEKINVGLLTFDDQITWNVYEPGVYSCSFTSEYNLSNIANSLANYGLSYIERLLYESDDGFTISEVDSQYTIYVRLKSCASVTEFMNKISLNPLTIIYELVENDRYIKKLPDQIQVNLAKLVNIKEELSLTTNGKSNITLSYPLNRAGAITLRGYNSPQRIMYTLNNETLYVTTK